MDTYICTIKLNITQGFGNLVLDQINAANISQIFQNEFGKHGEAKRIGIKWNTGILTHDLYLKYRFKIFSYRLVKANSNKWIAKVLKYSFLLKNMVQNKLQSNIEKRFKDNLSDIWKHLAVIFRSCEVLISSS